MVEDSTAAPAETSSPPSAEPASPSPASSPSPSPSAPESSGEPSKGSLLDAVLKVVPATNETDVLAKTDDPAAPPADQPETTDQAEETEDESSSTEDDDAPAPAEAAPAIRKKINKLLKQRRELRNEVEQLRGAAGVGSELEQFAQANRLSGEDVANTLKLAAMLRAGDYQSFYQAIAPFVRTAQEYLGVVLPRDLAERVRVGHMTESAAKEFARQRFDTQRSQFELQQTHGEVAQRQVQAVQTDVQRAVTNYEHRLSASDPDYKAKAPSVRRAAQALLFERGGTINSVQEALEITKAAYDEVNKHLRSFNGKPSATPKQPNGASQTTSARAAPKTLMEAALLGLENARRAGG